MPVNSRIQLRRGTSSQWLSTSDILASGEMGYDTIENNIKIGNGIDLWANLPWLVTSQTGEFVASTGVFDVVAFDTEYEGPLSQGQISWDSTEGTLDVALTDSVRIHVGEHRFFRIRNETGSTLYKGQVVYATGVHANGIIEPSLYVADGSIREVRFMGSVLEDVNHNNNGFVVDFGHIEDIDLDGSATNFAVGDETWNAGDILYVHPTVPGKLTNVAPAHDISVAIILDPGNGNGNGKMFVRPDSYGHLDDNHDVNLSGLVDNNLMVWNSGANYWEPTTSMTFDGTTLHTDTDGITAIFGRNNSQTVGGKVRIYVDDADTAGSVQAIKAFNAKTTGTNFGINATANGLGATKNVGLYGWAAQATTNWGLWVDAGYGIFDDRVGIKTQSPTFDLHVNGSGYVNNSFYVDGNVGINTTSPNATLHVYSPTPSGTIFNAEGTNGSLFSVVDNLSGVLMSVNTIAGLPVLEVNSDYSITAGRFNQNDFVITSSGDIGMGITAPSGKLHVVGEAYVDNLKLDGNTLSSTDSNGNIYITPNGTGGVAGGSSTTVTSSYGTVGGGFGNISSGGSWSTVGGGRQNTASNNYTTIGGGCGNCANTLAATVAGGFWNKACGSYAFTGGGRQNTASGGYSFIGGGLANCSSANRSVVVGGYSNNVAAEYAFIVGGYDNNITGAYGSIGGGRINCVAGMYSFIGGGRSNIASGGCSTISGGYSSRACGACSTVGGGYNNLANGPNTLVAGGINNIAFGTSSAVLGGNSNQAYASYSASVGGIYNRACGNYSFIGGGYSNRVCLNSGNYNSIVNGQCNCIIADAGDSAFIGAGCCNVVASGNYATVVNGAFNVASGDYSAVVAGSGNATTTYSFIGGGFSNVNVAGGCSVISGGSDNCTNGGFNTITGGRFNRTCCSYSVAGGYSNDALGDYSFVGGGYNNGANTTHSAVAGGANNLAACVCSFVGGGYFNKACGDVSSILGGNANCAIGACSTVGGGYANCANGANSTVSGGYANCTNANRATVGGGISNYANGSHATISGGNSNRANGSFSFIGAGRDNCTAGQYTVIAGGWGNTASGDYSAILGGINNYDGNYDSVFILGSGITATAPHTTYTESLSVSNVNDPSGTIFNVEGSNGSLFSVVDNLSGVLMSVNNNAGLPVFEVYDDDSIIAGRFAQNDFVISSSGNVGIGTASPVTKLDVSGVITATGGNSNEWNEAYDWVAASGGLPYVTGVGTANQVAFFNGTDSITSESNLYWDSTNNRLGIGTTSPSKSLHIAKSTSDAIDSFIRLENNGRSVAIDFSAGTGGTVNTSQITFDWWGNSYGAGTSHGMNYKSGRPGLANHWFRDDTNAVQMSILDNGNVGVGTSSPTYKLHVAGDISANANNVYAGGFSIYGDTNNKLTKSGNDFTLSAGQTTTDIHLGYYDGGTLNKVVTVDSSEDRVGILNTAPAYTLDVTGSGRFTGDLYAGGNLGVGTTSPSSKLHVMGGTRIQGDSTNTTWTSPSPTLAIKRANDNPYMSFHRDNGNRLGYLQFNANSPVVFLTEAGYGMSFFAGGYNRLHIENGGDVGIGTDNPQYKLDVNGDSNLGGNVIVGGNLTVNGTTISTNVDTIEIQDPIITLGLTSGNIVTDDSYDRGVAMVTNDGTAFMGWDNSADEFVMLASGVATNGSGNYDAGTWGAIHAGSAKFEGSNTRLDIDQLDTTTMRIKPVGNLMISAGNSAVIRFAINSTEYARLKENGNFGIGTTSPAAKLHVEGDVITDYLRGDTYNLGAGGAIKLAASNTSTSQYLAFGKNASGIGQSFTEHARFTTDGNFGIGTTTPSYKLDVAGTTAITPTAATETLILGRNTGYASVKSTASNELILDSDSAYVSLNHYSSDDVILGYGGGNVGIGTATPSADLQIGEIAASQPDKKFIITGYNAPTIEFNGHLNWSKQQFIGGLYDMTYVNAGGQNNTYGSYFNIGNATYPKSNLRIWNNDSTQTMIFGSHAAYPIAYIGTKNDTTNYEGGLVFTTRQSTSVTNQVYIDKYGQLGLGNGTNALSAKLDVRGSAVFNEGGADYDFRVEGSGAPNALFVDGANGNVGIGTATPSSPLHVLETGGSTSGVNTALILDYESDTTTVAEGGTAIEFRGKSSGGNLANWGQARIRSFGYAGNNSHGIAFDTRPSAAFGLTEALRISNGGYVGIGTTSPGYKLHIGGAAPHAFLDGSFTSTDRSTHSRLYFNDNQYGIGAGQFNSSGDDDLYIWSYRGAGRNIRFCTTTNGSTNTTDAAWDTNAIITYDGKVGIGTTAPTTLLDVSGVITANGGNSNEWNEAYDWIQNSGLDGTGSASGVAFWTDANTLSYDSNFVWHSGDNKLGINIGSNTPKSAVEVNGHISLSPSASTTGWNNTFYTYNNNNTNNSYGFTLGHQASTARWSHMIFAPDYADIAFKFDPSGADHEASGQAIFTTRMLVRGDTGNVGIGTEDPGSRLSVVASGTGVYDGTLNVAEAHGLDIYNTQQTSDGSYASLTFRVASNSYGSVGTASVNCVNTGDGDGDLTFVTRNNAVTSEKMRIAYNGNVGIGTATPNSKLEVNGEIAAGGTSAFTFAGNSWGYDKIVFRKDVNNKITSDVNGNYKWYLQGKNLTFPDLSNDAKFGIWTDTPTQKLDVRYPVGGGMALLKSTDTTDGLLLGDMAYSVDNTYQGIKHVAMTGSYDYMMISNGTHTFISAAAGYDTVIGAGGNSTNSQIRVKPTEVVVNEQSSNLDFRVESNNNANMLFVDGVSDMVGIGTGSPAQVLHVYGGTISSERSATAGSPPSTYLSDITTAPASGIGSFHSHRFNTASTPDFAGKYGILQTSSSANDRQFQVYVVDSVTPKMVVNGNGNVGIGTASPSNPLEIYANGPQIKITDALGAKAAFIEVDHPNNNFNLDWVSTTTRNINFINSSTGGIKVGVNTTTPSTQFDVAGSGNFSGDVTIDGHLSAATKSFLIKHPTREGHKLQYGSLESPYHGVRLTGRAKVENGWCVVKLPEYISELVHNNNDINIQITNIKHGKVLYVDDTNIANNEFTVKTDSWFNRSGLEFYWTFTAVRKDVKELQVEF